jgi:hypothetical protein
MQKRTVDLHRPARDDGPHRLAGWMGMALTNKNTLCRAPLTGT